MTPGPFSLDGEVSIVTGGSSGIGLAAAHAMHNAGSAVALVARGEDRLRAAVSELPGAVGIAADVSSDDAVALAVDEVIDRFGALSCVVNAAGATATGGATTASDDELARAFDAHVIGPARVVRHAANALKKAGGSVINIGSMYSFVGSPVAAPYVAAKHAVVGWTRALAMELAVDGVRANAIAPGFIATAMTDKMRSGDRAAEIVGRTPLGRWGAAEDVAGAVVFLASPAASFITGETIVIDGGWSISDRSSFGEQDQRG